MYLNNYSEICTEPSALFAPYPGQVLTLRYHVEKGSRVGFITSREGFTNVHTEVVVVEVAYGSIENQYGYAFSFAPQDMGRPALYPHSKIGMLQFPFINWQMKNDESATWVDLNNVITRDAPNQGTDYWDSLVPIDNIPKDQRLYNSTIEHWDKEIMFTNTMLETFKERYCKDIISII